ncbi:unnamed protein product [Arctia plantaginis]|uniref:Zinc finger PHD-type domain-containing protein n=1 Tax=Arctia plantaginis TaxID=874455 RepID=A0A8S0ZMH3_ARCPL|nr:unnamed protein product [Arctia plantaginis]
MKFYGATGLYPYNPEAIPNEAYAPSVLTERPPEQEHVATVDISPAPGPSNINLRLIDSPRADSSDSDQTYFNRSPCSPSLLQPIGPIPLSPPSIPEAYSRFNKKIVNYSSTDTDPENYHTTITRPIIYSSESDFSFDEALISQHIHRPNFESITNIYSSSDDENRNPGSMEQHTPIQQINISSTHVDVIGRDHHLVSSDEDSEDNIPLENLRVPSNSATTSSFQQLIPTPNYVVIKNKPRRRKAINYKGRIITKDLFKEKEKKKEMKRSRKTEHESQRYEKSRKKPKTDFKKKTKKTKEIDDDNDKWYCHACNAERCEDMRQCPLCRKWFHEECLGLTKEDIDFDLTFDLN